jgi:hypothetical protein
MPSALMTENRPPLAVTGQPRVPFAAFTIEHWRFTEQIVDRVVLVQHKFILVA